MKVEELMRKIVITSSPDSSLSEAIDLLSNEDSGRVVITEGEELRGILSTRDVVKLFADLGYSIFNRRVREVMSDKVVTVSPKTHVEEAVRIMLSRRVGGLPVLDGKVIAGLFTEREIIKVVKNSDTPSLVDAFMTRDPIVADADLSLEEASKLMRDLGIRRIPLVKGDSLVGIITAADIVKYLRRYAERGERQDRAIAVGTRNPVFVSRYERVKRAAEIMESRRIGTLPVLERKIEGIITERDLLFSLIH
jgi:CBS domain-containing protein